MTSVNGAGAQPPELATDLTTVMTGGAMLPEGLVVVARHRHVESANAKALSILGCVDTDLVGRPLADGLPLTHKYGRDWWAHTDPWNGSGSRTEQREELLVAPRGHDVLVTARYVRTG